MNGIYSPPVVAQIDLATWARLGELDDEAFLDDLAASVLTHELTPEQARALAEIAGLGWLRGLRDVA